MLAVTPNLEGMARSPLTLAAAATAAVPGVEIIEVTGLTTDEGGRNDSAMATLADGRRIVIRHPQDDVADAELAAEALALRALSDGVRALLSFQVPEFLGAAPLGGGRLFVTTFIPGYLVDAPHIPGGRGVATSLGASLAAVHALPTAVVRGAGLPSRTAAEVRADARRVMDESSATGRVPVRLMVRWREVLDDDAMWQFEPTVTLGGVSAAGFVYQDKSGEPAVNGIIDWHGLQVSDPAIDLQFLQSAPEASDTVYAAYTDATNRAADDLLPTRARLHSELEFAKWLLHGRDAHREDIMDDAARMLDELAEDVRHDDLHRRVGGRGVDDAIAALDVVPDTAGLVAVDTSMQTDTYDPDDLRFYAEDEARRIAASFDTAAVEGSPVIASDASTGPDTQRIDPLVLAETDPNATQPISPSVPADRPGVDRIDPDFLAGLQKLHDTGDLTSIASVQSGLGSEAGDDADATRPIEPLFGDENGPDGASRSTGMHDD